MIGCASEEQNTDTILDVERLLDQQVSFLAKSSARLTKTAAVGDQLDTFSFKPDSAAWSSELEIFRFLNTINRSIYADAYRVEDNLADEHSNLKIRKMTAKRGIPIQEFSIYYLDNPADIRKIQARIEERNALYYSSRSMSLQLDSYQDRFFISRYQLSGMQKMVLQDTVRYQVDAIVELE